MRTVFTRAALAGYMLLGALCCGCARPEAEQREPARHLEKKVEDEAILGTWFLTEDSLALLRRDGFQLDGRTDYTATFRTDGSLAFQSVLADFQGGEFHDVAGTWLLEHEIVQGQKDHGKNVLLLNLSVGGSSYICDLCLGKDKAGLFLWEFYGNPNQQAYLEYRRAPS